MNHLNSWPFIEQPDVALESLHDLSIEQILSPALFGR
jgi:hypothetical protein